MQFGLSLMDFLIAYHIQLMVAFGFACVQGYSLYTSQMPMIQCIRLSYRLIVRILQ